MKIFETWMECPWMGTIHTLPPTCHHATGQLNRPPAHFYPDSETDHHR